MEKLNLTMANRLVSFDKAEEISRMNKKERLAFNNDVKKQAAYLMLSVSRAVENKDYKTAKTILIYIADSCSCIQDPDNEVRYLIEVCCQHLAFIRDMETSTKERNVETRSEYISSNEERKPIYVFKYNKFSGEFECDEDDKGHLNHLVLFYMSKLNAILFSNQNTEHHHSLVGMLMVYYPFFLMVGVLIVMLFILVFTRLTQSLGFSEGTFWNQVPIIVCCLLFGIPLWKIYSKEPIKKDSSFFEKKLG